MKTIDIVIEVVSKKIEKPENIFLEDITFDNLLFWCRECTRERLSKHYLQQDLSKKVDDIGMEVDRYLIQRRLKMLENGKQGKNSLYHKLNTAEETITWLVSRWGNVFLNLATNCHYKDFFDAGNIGYELNDNLAEYSEDTLSILINEEEKQLEEKRKNRFKKQYENLNVMLHNGKIGGESSECGHTQMVFIFK